jgi:hypothetical protein
MDIAIPFLAMTLLWTVFGWVISFTVVVAFKLDAKRILPLTVLFTVMLLWSSNAFDFGAY